MSSELRRIGVYGRCIVDGAVLLTRLSRLEPDRGKWTLPGGGVEFGESPTETLVREFDEETGLEPRIGPFLDVYSRVYPPNARRGALHVLQFVYEVTASGEPEVRELDGSTSEVAWVDRSEVGRLELVDLAVWALAL
ncbi:MAG: NUDIX domain-containing protein [Acidimicrobiia bacterium]